MSNVEAEPQGEYYALPQEHVVFGAGSLARLGDEVARVGGQRALVVTGRSLAGETNVVSDVVAALGPCHAGTFAEVRQHTPGSDVARATALARDVGADTLVSVGGGSVIDATKAVARALERAGSPLLPHIAIPTTLSAAEFSHLVGVTDEARRAKAGFADPHLAPRAVILDARLTLPTPPRLWLSSGIRALDHAVETLYAPGAHPIGDVLALEAIRRLFAGLPRSHQQPDDLDARTSLQLAAWMSFFGEVNTPMGLSHNLGRRIGATYDVPHGITSCITLPRVMRALAPRHAPALATIARMLALVEARTDDLTAALVAADAVGDLIGRLGLPRRLRDVGIDEAALDDIARAMAGMVPPGVDLEALLHELL